MAWSNVVNVPFTTDASIGPPSWDTITPQTYPQGTLPDTLGMAQFILSDGGSPVTSYADLAPVAGVSLDTVTGIYSIADTVAVQTHAMQTTATNAAGTSSPVAWSLIITGLGFTAGPTVVSNLGGVIDATATVDTT